MRTKLTLFNRLQIFWKQKHMNQIVLLIGSTLILALLSVIYFSYRDVHIRDLNPGLLQATKIYDSEGKVASKISGNKTEGAPIEQIPQYMKDAIVATEDHRFYEHHGIDYLGIGRAFFKNMKAGEVVEGGSTITQQLTKNALLTSEKTYKRKLEEFFIAKEIEKQYTKDQILEMYLNQIYFGARAWGIKNASMQYFGKDVPDLTISESAMLAGLVKAPSALNPYEHIKKATERRNVVLSLMVNQHFISQKEYEKAMSEKIVLNDKVKDPLKGMYPYYVDHVLEEAINKYGFTQDELLTGGYKIYTELDPHMQSEVEETYKNDNLFPAGTQDQLVQSGAILIDPKSGGIRALVGGRGEHVFRGYNRATQLKAQPGSSIKPIAAYAPALEAGWEVTDELVDEKLSFGDYQPDNYNHQYLGKVPMYQAVKDSINLPAVWLMNEIGLQKGIDTIKNFGIPLEKGDRHLSLALGGFETGVSPLNMAQAYSAFANDGEQFEAHVIKKIVDADGKVVAKWDEKKKTVISQSSAKKMTTMLLGVVEQGTGKAAQVPGREIAGKTGSTQVPIEGINGVKDQWFVGYTPQLVGAVWVGYDKTDEKHYLTTTSSEGAAPVFREIMEKSLGNTKAVSFNVPHISTYIAQRQEAEREKRAKELQEQVKKEVEQWKNQVKNEKKKKWKEKGKGHDHGKHKD